jgi:hypothetical protein
MAAALASVLEWAGRPEVATEAYAVAIRMDSTLTQSSYWFATTGRAELRSRAIELSGISSCEWGRNVALYGSYGDDLAALTLLCRDEISSVEDRAALAIMLQAQGLHADALREIEVAINASSDPSARAARGYVYATQDIEIARREFLAAYLAGDKDALVLLSLTYSRGTPAALASTFAPNWLRPDQPLPEELLTRLRRANSPRSWLADFTYYALLHRVSPLDPLIPGEWQELRSPRDVITVAIVNAVSITEGTATD